MPDPELEFVNFIIKLAASRQKLQAFLEDPGIVAREAGLSEEQVNALVNGEGEVRLNELVKADLSEWLLAKFQGAPLVDVGKSTKSGKGKKGKKGGKSGKKPGKK